MSELDDIVEGLTIIKINDPHARIAAGNGTISVNSSYKVRSYFNECLKKQGWNITALENGEGESYSYDLYPKVER